MTPTLLQYLLSAELSPAKAEQVAQDVTTGSLDPVVALRAHPALTESERRRMNLADLRALERSLDRDLWCLLPDDYPETLAEAPGMPPGLFGRGNRAQLERRKVAIVGTRKASGYGLAAAQKFAEGLAAAGVCVVSGGAFGIDRAAHEGAISGGGHTIAVLTAGVDRPEPSQNGLMFEAILNSGGVLLSQWACGSPSLPHRPLHRNAVVAGLSEAVLVIEAPPKSGSLNTAQAALDMGRDVFVVPGDIGRANFWGSHQLIRDGAQLVFHPKHVLEALGIEPVEAEERSETNEDQDRILEVLADGPIAAEMIVARTGMDPALVLSELTMLELDGRIIRDGPGFALRP